MNENRLEGPCWYVIRTAPKQEERAIKNLNAWGLRTLLQRLRARRINQFTGKPSYASGPMFPRYAFAWFDASILLRKVWYTRGVHSVVSFGGSPTKVDDSAIELIQSQ